MSENQKNPNQGQGGNKEQTGKNNPGDGRDQKNKQPMKEDQPKREGNFGPNDPNDPNSPEKKIQIDDNPSETEKKIPHMKNDEE